jgi:hypothetical protein
VSSPAGQHVEPDVNPSAVEAATRLEIDPAVFAESFDYRPFALRHSLHTHPAFDFDSLLALASRSLRRDTAT